MSSKNLTKFKLCHHHPINTSHGLSYKSLSYQRTILHNMIIDNERDSNYDENYHIVTYVVAPPINYEVLVSLINILQRKPHMTWIDVFELSI
jgi:hypothetical protein